MFSTFQIVSCASKNSTDIYDEQRFVPNRNHHNVIGKFYHESRLVAIRRKNCDSVTYFIISHEISGLFIHPTVINWYWPIVAYTAILAMLRAQ